MLLDNDRGADNIGSKYGREIFWLLDVRFDFLLPKFMNEYGLQKQDITLVDFYCRKIRNGWKQIYVSDKEQENTTFLEADTINRLFSKSLRLDDNCMIISLTGAGLPESDNWITLTSAGKIAELCNDKWWQYRLFRRCKIKTPDTYKYILWENLEKDFQMLVDKYGEIIIKRPRLSGGYMMKVLDSDKELEEYKLSIKKEYVEQDFLISKYIVHQQSFASMGVILKDGKVFCMNIVAEQVLHRQVEYVGLIFPAFIDDYYMEEIQNMTISIGKALSKEGYRGYFNIDFILANEQLYAIEINARLGFSTILIACLYGEKFWKVMRGECTDKLECLKKRIIIGKIKGKKGKVYSNLKDCSDIVDWFKNEKKAFKTFYCGLEEPEEFKNGGFIGLFGEKFSLEDSKEMIVHEFMKSCLEYY